MLNSRDYVNLAPSMSCGHFPSELPGEAAAGSYSLHLARHCDWIPASIPLIINLNCT